MREERRENWRETVEGPLHYEEKQWPTGVFDFWKTPASISLLVRWIKCPYFLKTSSLEKKVLWIREKKLREINQQSNRVRSEISSDYLVGNYPKLHIENHSIKQSSSQNDAKSTYRWFTTQTLSALSTFHFSIWVVRGAFELFLPNASAVYWNLGKKEILPPYLHSLFE